MSRQYYIVLVEGNASGIKAVCTYYSATSILTEDEADDLIEELERLHGTEYSYFKLPIVYTAQS